MENSPTTTTNRVEVLIVIDTDAIIKKCLRKSLDKTRPIPTNKLPQSVFCSGAVALKSNPGDSSLAIVSTPDNVIQIRATSVYQNSTDAVTIYQIIQSGDQPFVPNSIVIEKAVQPNPDSTSGDGLPALQVEESFMSLDSKFTLPGIKNYIVCFAIYRLDADGETQNLYGYYSWNLRLNILQ